ncbi:MAG: beta-ketoacyl-[acyl-carrier-protein] synthase family protein [Pseudomonadota bacterium]
MTRIAITGLGQISSLGHDVEAFWSSTKAGRSGIDAVGSELRDQLNHKMAAEVRGYEPKRHFDHRQLNVLDRYSQFAIIAAREAVKQAKLDLSGPNAADTAVIAGTGSGGMTTLDDSYERMYGRDARVHPLTIPRYMISAAASQISMELGIRGPCFSVASACSTSNHALGVALMMLRTGQARFALAGGSEASVVLGPMRAWEALRVISQDTCRPFCIDRTGMIVGEGAGILVLETFESAEQRGVPILAELAGFGFCADAGDLVQPALDGAVSSMQRALADGGVAPEEIDYINAHGTGTKLNDKSETRAVREVFGKQAEKLAMSSTKSMHGHCLGASGALEMIATVQAMREGIAPPTANFTNPDPDCDLDYVPNKSREMPIRAALSNSFAFGGLNAALVVRAAPR